METDINILIKVGLHYIDCQNKEGCLMCQQYLELSNKIKNDPLPIKFQTISRKEFEKEYP